ncbi:MAG: aldo/keto reductase [Porticoccaceae bacterium]|jgi:predicted oxidoreductase|nr:aldo/keto reductase [Porticoccaceae bacterium]MBT6318760.1 aldo/keto reductase [Porticoccaceae bacterium]MBT7905732.1 aldo/keto reductase [Porticoccaceae bacterium]MDA8734503.1 aldo/keto reductase [Porticoccaceae bacterium]MDB2481150.1 aldo/keto reductase [Porticoccaceae bacterium]
MEKIILGNTGASESLSVSRIIYGMWRLGDDPDTSPKHIQAKIEACLEQGISTFDQADIYGAYTAEGLLGAALKQAPALRGQMEIITKCDIVAPIGMHADKRVKYYDSSQPAINQAVDRSLQEMAIEQIDLLLIHRPDPLMDADETGEALDGLIASGKVKALGVSNFRPWDMDLLQSRMNNRLVANQIEISLAENTALTNGDLAYLQQHKIAPMAWSPLAGGQLLQDSQSPLGMKLKEMAAMHGVAPSSMAVAWLLRHPAAILPVMGSNSIERIKLFGEAMNVQLDRQSWFELLEAAMGHEVA